MPISYDKDIEDAELEFRKQNLAAIERDNEHKRRHEENLLKLKIELATKRKRSVGRVEALQRFLIALVKLPTLMFVWPLLGILLAMKREVPPFIVDYINL